MKKSFKIAIAGALALLMLAVFGLQLFAADKVIDSVMPASGVSVNAFRNNVPNALEVANLSNMKFSIANADSGTMNGKASVPILYVRNPVSSASDRDFMVYSIDGNKANPNQISAIFLNSANFTSLDELKAWLISVMGNDTVISTGDELIPAYTDTTVDPAVNKPAVTWTSLVAEHGPIKTMNFTGQGTIDPSDATGKTVLPKNEDEMLEIFDLYQPISFTATSCVFEDDFNLTADTTETEKAKAEALNAGGQPPAAPTTGTWIITISKALALRDSHYVTANYGTNAMYDKVAWVLNHSYPVLSMHDTFADAGVNYADLINRFSTSYNVGEAEAAEYVRLFTYAIIQYALYYHTGYSEESATPGVNAELGNKIVEGVPELTALYEYLTRDRNYDGYAAKTMDNEMKLTGIPGAAVGPNTGVTEQKADGWNYYGPFLLESDLFSAGDIELTLSGFDTNEPGGALIPNVPKLAKGTGATRYDTMSVRQGEAFFVAIAEDYSTEDVSGVKLNFSFDDGTAEGSSKSRMFHHVPHANASANDPDYAPLAVGASTVGAQDGGELDLPTFEKLTGRSLVFSASGEENAPLEGVEIIVKDSTGSEVARGTTNAEGKYTPAATFDFDATYSYKELNVPDGYALNTTEYTITVGPDNVPETIPNVKTNVEIRKLKLSDRTTPMPGATIAIYKASDPTVVVEYLNNDNTGTFKKIGLPWGEYKYREQLVTGTNTYEPIGDIYSFAIAQDGTPSGTLVFYGDEDVVPGQATIRVVDDAGNPIAGSTVIVYPEGEEDDPVGTFTTNSEGYITTGELEPGEYRYKQTGVPDGYRLNDTVRTFEVDDDGEIEPAPADIVSARIKKEVTITAYDTVTNNPIKDVEISVYPRNTTNKTTITTGTDGKAKAELYYGEYVFEQKTAVTGYTTNTNKYYFTVASSISGDSRLPLTPATTGGNNNQQTTTPTTDGTISVIAGDTLTGLAGAVVRVYNSTGAVVYEGTTDANGKITLPTTLAAGTYTYKMVSAPSGYSVNAQTFTFTKGADGVYTGLQQITSPVVTITIKKVSAKDTTKTLSGATLTLYSSTGTALDTKVTGSNGIATFTKLAYGSYYIKETAAPSGYTLSSDVISFTIDATYVNKGEQLFKNSTAVQTGGEMAIVYGVICVIGLAGAAYMLNRKRVNG